MSIREELDSSGELVAHYAEAENIDDELALVRSGVASYYEADGLGSITSLSNSGGTLVQHYTFDTFGDSTSQIGSITNPLRFTGRDFDSETGLLNLRVRYLEPSVGRFLGEDPIRFKGGRDFYIYAQNNPVISIDPFGLQPRPTPPRPCSNLEAWNCAVKCGGWDNVLSCQVPRAWSFLRAKEGLILWGYVEGLPDCKCKPGGPTECPKRNQPDPKAVNDLKKFMVAVGIGTAIALAPETGPILWPEWAFQ